MTASDAAILQPGTQALQLDTHAVSSECCISGSELNADESCDTNAMHGLGEHSGPEKPEHLAMTAVVVCRPTGQTADGSVPSHGHQGSSDVLSLAQTAPRGTALGVGQHKLAGRKRRHRRPALGPSQDVLLLTEQQHQQMQQQTDFTNEPVTSTTADEQQDFDITDELATSTIADAHHSQQSNGLMSEMLIAEGDATDVAQQLQPEPSSCAVAKPLQGGFSGIQQEGFIGVQQGGFSGVQQGGFSGVRHRQLGGAPENMQRGAQQEVGSCHQRAGSIQERGQSGSQQVQTPALLQHQVGLSQQPAESQQHAQLAMHQAQSLQQSHPLLQREELSLQGGGNAQQHEGTQQQPKQQAAPSGHPTGPPQGSAEVLHSSELTQESVESSHEQMSSPQPAAAPEESQESRKASRGFQEAPQDRCVTLQQPEEACQQESGASHHQEGLREEDGDGVMWRRLHECLAERQRASKLAQLTLTLLARM